MRTPLPHLRPWLLVALLATLASIACSRSSSDALAPGGGNGGGGSGNSNTRLIVIEPGPQAETRALTAFFEAREGDTIQFGPGLYEFGSGLILSNVRGVTIRGAGMDKTFLSFRNSSNKEGIFATHVLGLTIEDLTVEDMPGDGVKISDARHITLRRVKVRWTNADPEHPNYDASRASWANNGAYAFYPVLAEDVLVEHCVSIGSSDVGFYVGQSQDVVVRRNLAFHNVQGYEFENTDDSEMYENVARDNAGGFLAVDLPGRTRFGDRNRFYRNVIENNNIDNFAPKGTIAAAVPRGTGLIILATDQVEVFDNDIRNNDTLGIVVVSYRLLDSSRDPRFDYYAEGIHIHHNRFANNGRNPQLPKLGPEDLPDPTANPSLLPLLIMLKNFGQTAHIVWDGYTDTRSADCAVPAGVPTDERGKPQYRADDEAPDCGAEPNGVPVRYNAYKFDAQGNLKKPANWLCIRENQFNDSGLPTPRFVNFQGTVPNPEKLPGSLSGQDQLLASRDEAPFACELPALPPTVIEPYVPGAGQEAPPSPEEIRRVCEAVQPGKINRAALAYNCPRLSHYGLFSDPEDPRSVPNEGGVPFDLTTPLFSDYALKYRVAFLPPGVPAQWRDHNDGPNAHLQFPVGTVIAKTFAFRDGASENVVETRLLIKRQTPTGPSWQGLPYLWRTDASGKRYATLEITGATASVSWDYEDPDPRARNAAGQRPRYAGATPSYSIPQAAQCVTCHAREDLEGGSAPIGPKPRALNRDYDYGGGIGVRNQLAYWRSSGLLVGGPADLAEAEFLPEWNVPGASGQPANSPADVEARARAYLEANCAHCHTPKGVAKSTRLSLDQWILSNRVVAPRPVNRDYGICKSPVASGRGTGNRLYDIVPGDAPASILEFRLGNADDAAVRMPPIAKSVVHAEGHALITQWINLLPLPTTEDDNCSGAAGSLPAPLGDVLGALPLP
jgi:parallel beta-helix repeat protein